MRVELTLSNVLIERSAKHLHCFLPRALNVRQNALEVNVSRWDDNVTRRVCMQRAEPRTARWTDRQAIQNNRYNASRSSTARKPSLCRHVQTTSFSANALKCLGPLRLGLDFRAECSGLFVRRARNNIRRISAEYSRRAESLWITKIWFPDALYARQ